jgi:hypothetical protein
VKLFVGIIKNKSLVKGFGCVFVGAFSGFGDLLYRIPAPIFSQKQEKSSTPHE